MTAEAARPVPPKRRGRPPSSAAQAAKGEATASAEPRVDAVERALSLLEAFTDGRPRLTLSELAARAGLYPSTVLRLAGSLIRFGYLHRDVEGAFRLGPTPLRLGLLYREAFNLADRVRPALAALTARTGETAGFYVREGAQRICLFRHHSDRLIRHHVEEGSRLPLDRGASGRVLTAYTNGDTPQDAAVRARGVYVSLGERDPETAAVAAPVFAPDGLAGALGVVGPLHRFDPANCERLAGIVAEAAQDLSRILGGTAPPRPETESVQRRDTP
jgi:DNA-binding IclR family transcriptional regulator